MSVAAAGLARYRPPVADPRDVLLVMADISGYTRFMVANAAELGHGQAIITALLEAVLARVELPMRVAKLEGDAVFLYAERGAAGYPRELGAGLLRFFDAFAEALARIAHADVCTCGACKNAPLLRLKVIAHAGKALPHRVGELEELAGVDVIVVHRLLKNSVGAAEYLLLSEAAAGVLTGLEGLSFDEYTERYDEIGPVKVRVHVRGESQRAAAEEAWKGALWPRRFVFARRWLSRLRRAPAAGGAP